MDGDQPEAKQQTNIQAQRTQSTTPWQTSNQEDRSQIVQQFNLIEGEETQAAELR